MDDNVALFKKTQATWRMNSMNHNDSKSTDCYRFRLLGCGAHVYLRLGFVDDIELSGHAVMLCIFYS